MACWYTCTGCGKRKERPSHRYPTLCRDCRDQQRPLCQGCGKVRVGTIRGGRMCKQCAAQMAKRPKPKRSAPAISHHTVAERDTLKPTSSWWTEKDVHAALLRELPRLHKIGPEYVQAKRPEPIPD